MIKYSVHTSAYFLIALMIYFMPLDIIAAYTLAIIVHELGHILCLMMLGCRICGLSLGFSGLVIEHNGGMTQVQNVICALAGPGAGLLFAYFASYSALASDNHFMELCAGLSLILTTFNLLPVLPLDGGVALKNTLSLFFTDKVIHITMNCIGGLISAGLAVCSVTIESGTVSPGLLLAAMSLITHILLAEGIVKKAKLR